MIDIHSHIISGLDDGAKSLNESIMMAKIAVNEGIHTIIATPHYIDGEYNINKLEILKKVNELNETLESEDISLRILPGQEIRIHGDLVKEYRAGNYSSLNDGGKYLLLELPSNHVPRYTEQLLYDIQFEGLTPIIAHPERNKGFIENPSSLYNLVKNGALTQITASSLIGTFGKKAKKLSYQLIESNLTHFIASDSHNCSSRVFNMKKALNLIQNKYGMDQAEYFTRNAELLVQGKSVHIYIPQKVKQRKVLGIF